MKCIYNIYCDDPFCLFLFFEALKPAVYLAHDSVSDEPSWQPSNVKMASEPCTLPEAARGQLDLIDYEDDLFRISTHYQVVPTSKPVPSLNMQQVVKFCGRIRGA